MDKTELKAKQDGFPFTPTQDWLVLVPTKEDDTIDLGGGKKLFLPESGKRPLNQGVVIEKGINCSERIEVGMDVVFPLHREERIQIDRDWYYLVREEEVMVFRRSE